MKGDQLLEMLAKYFKEECSKNEIEKINKWVEESTENKIEFNKLRELWGNVQHDHKQFDLDIAWDKVESRLNSTERSSFSHVRWNKKEKSIGYKILKMAATIIVIIGASYFGITQLYFSDIVDDESKFVKEIIAARGEIKKIKLDDGTLVTLNSGSKLQTPQNMNVENRAVHLSGEAFFEVAPIKDRPFFVNSNNAMVEVIGTKFNITAWGDNDEVTVAVTEGKVLFNNINNDSRNAVIISKGEMSKITSGKIPLKPVKVEVEKKYLYWLNNELRFYNSTLRNVIHRLELHYDIDIKVNDLSILSKHLTAKFEDEPLDEVLNSIALALDLKYLKENNKKILLRYNDDDR